MAVLHLRYSDSSANSTAVVTYNQSIKNNATYANVSYSTGGKCLQLRTSTGTSAVVSYPITTGSTSRGLNFHLSDTASTWHIGSSTLTTLDTVFGIVGTRLSFASSLNTATPLSSITLPGMSYTYPVYKTSSTGKSTYTTTSTVSQSSSTSKSTMVFYISTGTNSVSYLVGASITNGYTESTPFVGYLRAISTPTSSKTSSNYYTDDYYYTYSVSSYAGLHMDLSTSKNTITYKTNVSSGSHSVTATYISRSTSAYSKGFSYSNTWSAPVFYHNTVPNSGSQTWTFRAGLASSLSTFISNTPISSVINTSYPLFVVHIKHGWYPQLVACESYCVDDYLQQRALHITDMTSSRFLSYSNAHMKKIIYQTSVSVYFVCQGLDASWTQDNFGAYEYFDAAPRTAPFQPTNVNSLSALYRWPTCDFDGVVVDYCPRGIAGDESDMSVPCGVTTAFGWDANMCSVQIDGQSMSMIRGRCCEKRPLYYTINSVVTSSTGFNTVFIGSMSSTSMTSYNQATATSTTTSTYSTTSGNTTYTSQKSSTSPVTVYQWPASSSNATSYNTATVATNFSVNTTVSYRTAIVSYKTASLYNHYNSHILVTRTTFGSATYTNQQSLARAVSQDIYTPISITMITNTTNGTKGTTLAPSNTSYTSTATGTWITTYNNYVSTTTVTFSVSKRLVSQAVATSVPKVTISSRNYSDGSFTTTLQTSAIRYALGTAKTTTRTVSAPYISTSATKAYTI